MDENSSKLPESGNAEVSAAVWLREWLRLEGGNNRSAHVLAVLAEQTERCLRRGEPSPSADMETLREVVLRTERGSSVDVQPLAKWLPRKQLQIWWDSREERRTGQALTEGLSLRPRLVAKIGGGRSNVNRFSLEFEPIDQARFVEAAGEAESLASTDHVTYSGQQLKGSILYRWLLPGHPVRVQSWRGLLLVGGLILSVLVALAAWILFLLILRRGGPLNSLHVTFALLAVGVTMGMYLIERAWINLPEDRLVIAPDVVLPWAEPYGQLQLIRDKESKRSGWLNLVRYSGTCPVCAGTIELTSGRRDFPGRIIGRCRDSPLEHVYSFDPVSLSGRSLR